MANAIEGMPDWFSAAFTQRHAGRMNNLITECGVSLPTSADRRGGARPPIHQTTGLWDTGATNSVITEATALAMGLKPSGKTQSHTAGGVVSCNLYLVNLYLPNNVTAHGVQVTEMKETVGGFGVLIGMDVISQGDFSITNVDGKTTFSFRMPSRTEIDYEAEAREAERVAKQPVRVEAAPYGRNDKVSMTRPDGKQQMIKGKHVEKMKGKGWTLDEA